MSRWCVATGSRNSGEAKNGVQWLMVLVVYKVSFGFALMGGYVGSRGDGGASDVVDAASEKGFEVLNSYCVGELLMIFGCTLMRSLS